MSPPPETHIFTIAAGADFAEALAAGIDARLGRGAEVVIYLPTRRAVSNFADAFARHAGGAALLPDMRALGDIDEDDPGLDPFTDDLALAPAVTPRRRLLLLASLVRRWSQNRAAPLSFAASAKLAEPLAAALDEAAREGADLSRLEALAPAALADHWAEVRDFLLFMQEEWPALLSSLGLCDIESRRTEILRRLAAGLREKPPEGWVIAAGSTGSAPAVADLLGAIAALPRGAVILPGLDRAMDAQSWDDLDPGHPQYGMKLLLDRLGARRADVEDWIQGETAASENKQHARERLLREALRPAPTTDAWRALADAGAPGMAEGLDGLRLIEAADPDEEAAIIALALRHTLDVKGKTAALITRDRNLARRVAVRMAGWNIAIDDSAGRPLPHTKAGAFLCLLAEAVDADFAPVPLLALLKHPLAAMGDKTRFRKMARALDLKLRGPRPDGGPAFIAERLNGETASWFEAVAGPLQPLADALAGAECDMKTALVVHIAAAEALAGLDLWSGPDGAAAADFVRELIDAAEGLPAIESRAYAPLFAQMARGVPVRPPYRSHPRLAILGPLEARLQHFDLTVLGGLNEGVWPAAASGDPWFSRPMRAALGLSPPERAIGLAAHDFAMLASGREVLLTRALKSDGAPAVAARWLQRLVQLTRGIGLEENLRTLRPEADYPAFAAKLNVYGESIFIKPPAPAPPAGARPRRLSVTEIETWLRDPYAIYAKHVLKLERLDPLDAEIGPLERGTILHKALEIFVRDRPGPWAEDAALDLIALAEDLFAEARTPKAALALWRPRFARAAFWFARIERERREAIKDSLVEIAGALVVPAPGGDFTLVGRADRIDLMKDGGAAIIDYKTGALPEAKWLASHLAPQLALLGAMLAQGGFDPPGRLNARELLYIKLTGGKPPGELRPAPGDAAPLIAEALAKLTRLIGDYDDPSTPYLSRRLPRQTGDEGDYDHLARVREWSAGHWREAEE